MKYSESFKNIIIQNNTDLSSFDIHELYQWLISNFTTILSNQKIYIDSISSTPIKDNDYKHLFLIKGIDGDNVYSFEYGEYLNKDFLGKSLVQNNISRLSLLNFDSNEINLSKLNSSDYHDYALIKYNKRKTLIIF